MSIQNLRLWPYLGISSLQLYTQLRILKMKSSSFRMGRKSNDCNTYKKEERESWTQTWSEEGHVTTEAKIVMEPQAKGCQDAGKNSSLEPSEGTYLCQHLDFGLSAFSNKAIKFVVICYKAHRKLIQPENPFHVIHSVSEKQAWSFPLYKWSLKGRETSTHALKPKETRTPAFWQSTS